MEAMTSRGRQWYIAHDQQEYGPVSDAELEELIALGHLQPTDFLWREGFPNWRPAVVLFPTRKLGAQQAVIKEQSNSRVRLAVDRADFVPARQVTTWRRTLAKFIVALLCSMAIFAVYNYY
jgi:GYF domain 2